MYIYKALKQYMLNWENTVSIFPKLMNGCIMQRFGESKSMHMIFVDSFFFFFFFFFNIYLDCKIIPQKEENLY